jgi:tetratricopeptide (TPR) repeat protein
MSKQDRETLGGCVVLVAAIIWGIWWLVGPKQPPPGSEKDPSGAQAMAELLKKQKESESNLDILKPPSANPVAAKACRFGEFDLLDNLPDLAIQDFSEALQHDPKCVRAYSGRAEAYRRKGDPMKAAADYAEAARLDPEAAYRAGRRLLNWGKYQEAIAQFDLALQHDPKMAKAYFHRGVAHGKNGDGVRAIVDREMALRLDPSLAQTLPP